MNKIRKFLVVAVALAVPFFLFVLPVHPAGADQLGQQEFFFVDKNYDRLGRNDLSATLRYVSDHAYFYVDDQYWNSIGFLQKQQITADVETLADEFDQTIYPKETSFWGSEPNPGIDKDPRITILLEDLIRGNGGYFDTINESPKSKASSSNQRDMISIRISSLGTPLENVFLAHEFQHLISYNYKDDRGIAEETWLNELRSEYSTEVVGYEPPNNDPIFQSRVDTFETTPSDGLTDWLNNSVDYAQVSLFARYLADRYGPQILSETLHSSKASIASIDEFLQNHGYQERFADVFGDWAMANFLNSSSDPRYGYKEDYLKQFKVAPQNNFSISDGTQYSFNLNLIPWQATWQRFNVDSASGKPVAIKFNSDGFRVMYWDNLGRIGLLSSPAYISNSGGLEYFVLIPFNAGSPNHLLAVSMDYEQTQSQIMFLNQLSDGMLIHKAGSQDMYVIDRGYKRYLSPEIIKLYGHLDVSKAAVVDEQTFNSFKTSNYIRFVNDKKIYAVWPPDPGSNNAGSKHWLNMSAKYFSDSGRDWNSVFVINELELNTYSTGSNITK